MPTQQGRPQPITDAVAAHHLHLPTLRTHADGRVEVSLRRRDYQHLITALAVDAVGSTPAPSTAGDRVRALALLRVLVSALPEPDQHDVRETCREVRRLRRSA